MDVIDDIFKVLGGSAAFIAASAWLLRSVLDYQLSLKKKRDEIAAKEASQISRERNDRIRNEILRWANPILASVRDLRARLRNILHKGAHPGLHRMPATPVPAGWNISYDYFMPSTLYVFCQYFYWVKRFQEEMSFEIFRSQTEMDALVNHINAVSAALGDWPFEPACTGRDAQVFRLQQRVLGEALVMRKDGGRCMGYDDFFERWEERPLATHLAPLRSLLQDVENDGTCRWKRLEAVLGALDTLETACTDILRPPAAAA